MTVDDRGCGGWFARNTEENRCDIARGGCYRSHAEKERKRLDRTHLEHKWQHKRHCGGTTEAGEDSDDKTNRNPNEHQIEGREIKTLQESRN